MPKIKKPSPEEIENAKNFRFIYRLIGGLFAIAILMVIITKAKEYLHH